MNNIIADPREERLLTPAEVAEKFRVDRRTVSRWARSGKLRSIRTPGGRRRFPESFVLALLNAGVADGEQPSLQGVSA